MSDLNIKPISLKDANDFVTNIHRHHTKVQGHKFSIAAYNSEKLVGVCIVGRPVSRYLDDGKTLEVTRLCTDGTRNACSILYGRAARIAKDMGYKKIITYILQSESGVSLKASGWVVDLEKAGGGRLECAKQTAKTYFAAVKTKVPYRKESTLVQRIVEIMRKERSAVVYGHSRQHYIYNLSHYFSSDYGYLF